MKGLVRHENGQYCFNRMGGGMSEDPGRNGRPIMRLEGIAWCFVCSSVGGLVANEKRLECGMRSGNGRPHAELD